MYDIYIYGDFESMNNFDGVQCAKTYQWHIIKSIIGKQYYTMSNLVSH